MAMDEGNCGTCMYATEEGGLAICNNTDGLGGYYAKWNEWDVCVLVTQSCPILCDDKDDEDLRISLKCGIWKPKPNHSGVERGVQKEGVKEIKKYKSPVIKWVGHVDAVQC